MAAGIGKAICLVVWGAALFPGASGAETLADAIAAAYQSNPTLQSQRSQLRSLDEEYVQALSSARPTLSIDAAATYEKNQQRDYLGDQQETESNSVGAALTATQILYNGGRTAAGIGAAEADILAGREHLRLVEGQTLLSVVQSYCAVVRDQAIFQARKAALTVFQAQVDEIEARLAAGDVTRTDLGQAQSELATARADLANGQGQLQVSRAAFTAVVGVEPGELEPPGALPGLPPTAEEAFDQAAKYSPEILEAEMNERAARERVRAQRAQAGAQVTASASYGYTGPAAPYTPHDLERGISGKVELHQPLFTGGLTSSQIRQSLEADTNARILIEQARRDVVQQVSQNWSQMTAAGQAEVAGEAAIKGAEESSKGARIEYKGGFRSTLEVLIEEERLRDAQIATTQARYSAYVAGAGVLNALGRLESRQLLVESPRYDPVANFRKVRGANAFPGEQLLIGLDRAGEPGAAAPLPPPEPRFPQALSLRPRLAPSDFGPGAPAGTPAAAPFVAPAPAAPNAPIATQRGGG